VKKFAGALATAAVRVVERSGVDSITLRRAEKEFSVVETIISTTLVPNTAMSDNQAKYVCRVLARSVVMYVF
jgi:hypothetical protein